MIKGIFFDVGGTICGPLNSIEEKPSFKRVLANLTHRPVADFNVKKQNYLWTSSLSKKELILRLCRDLKINDWEDLYKSLSTYSCKVSLYKDVKPCLKRLSAKYKLGILSNTTPWTALDHHKLQIDKYVKTSILSCVVGAAKPDIKIFARAQKITGLDAQELLYVGDSFEYDIKPALKAGWKAVLLCRNKNNQNSLVPVIFDLFGLEEVLLEFNSIL